MPSFSQIRRDAVFATALGTRKTGNFGVLNQYSVTTSQASVISLVLPRQAQPEATVRVFVLRQADTSDHLTRSTIERQYPLPGISSLHRRNSDVR